MSFPKYPAYTDSGVEWIGEIPVGWLTAPLRAICVEKTAKNNATISKYYLSLIANIGVIPYDEKGDIGNKKPEDLSKCKIVSKNDFVINSMNFGIGSFGISAYDGICSPVYIVLQVKEKFHLNFFKYVFGNKTYQTYCQSFGNGILAHRAAISWDILKGIELPFPSLPEQKAIASFLDRECEKIDALIAEQERLIALLAEKRQAVISHAVTKGLNPNAPMKDSGIPWIGMVPAGWEVVRLKMDMDFLTSGSRGWAEYYSDNGALFLRIGNLTRNGMEIDLSDIQRVAVPENTEGERTRVQSGDVLFSITAYLGSVAVVPMGFQEAYVSQHVALARLNKKILFPEWVGFITLSDVGKNYLSSKGYGGTKIQLSLDDIANIIIPTPPRAEQKEIISYLNSKMRRFDYIARTASEAVTLLKERRAALISAAVTGKIDVRAQSKAVAA